MMIQIPCVTFTQIHLPLTGKAPRTIHNWLPWTMIRMPSVLLSPCDYAPDPSLYPCPVFRTPDRGGSGNLAMVLHLPITGAVTAWIERGVALSIEKQVRGNLKYRRYAMLLIWHIYAHNIFILFLICLNISSTKYNNEGWKWKCNNGWNENTARK